MCVCGGGGGGGGGGYVFVLLEVLTFVNWLILVQVCVFTVCFH